MFLSLSKSEDSLDKSASSSFVKSYVLVSSSFFACFVDTIPLTKPHLHHYHLLLHNILFLYNFDFVYYCAHDVCMMEKTPKNY